MLRGWDLAVPHEPIQPEDEAAMSFRTKVCAIGTGGQTRFGHLQGWSLEKMITSAAREALETAGVQPSDIGGGFVGDCASALFARQSLTSSLLAETAPELYTLPMTRYENACASASAAIMGGVTSILAGLHECVLVAGVEKMRGDGPKTDMRFVGEVLGTCAHPEDQAVGGFVFPRVFAQFMKAYIDRFGASEQELASVAVKNTYHAGLNPLAQLHGKKLTLEEAATPSERNPYMFEGLPLKARECCQVTDGAVAMVLCSEEFAKRLGKAYVTIDGFGQASDHLSLKQRDLTRPEGLQRAVRAAYSMSGVGPGDIDLAEVHDCFTVAEVLCLEALGRAEPGKGAALTLNGETYFDQLFPVNPSGGRIGMGHPVGATGLAMLRELCLQHLGRAGERQVRRARKAALVNFGGPFAAAYTYVTAVHEA
jgi:acetyl-CoA C-acetyltransferase